MPDPIPMAPLGRLAVGPGLARQGARLEAVARCGIANMLGGRGRRHARASRAHAIAGGEALLQLRVSRIAGQSDDLAGVAATRRSDTARIVESAAALALARYASAAPAEVLDDRIAIVDTAGPGKKTHAGKNFGRAAAGEPAEQHGLIETEPTAGPGGEAGVIRLLG
jgi:hypothetical protein